MRFLLDNDIPAEIARVLGQAGHHVVWVRGVMMVSANDSEVLDYAIEQGLVLLTCNRDDFLQLTRGRVHPGLIVVIRRRTRILECAKLLRLLERAGDVGIAGNVNFA